MTDDQMPDIRPAAVKRMVANLKTNGYELAARMMEALSEARAAIPADEQDDTQRKAAPMGGIIARHVVQTLADAIYQAAQRMGIANGDHTSLSVAQCLHLLECMSGPEAHTAQDERAAFEEWAKTQAESWLIVGGLGWSPGTNDYASARTNAAWAAWQERGRRARMAAPAAGTKAEHYDEVKATLQGAHRIMEGVSEIERKVGPIGSHARGYTHKITAALRHLDALYAAAPAAGDAQDAARYSALHWLAADSARFQAALKAASLSGAENYTPENFDALADAAIAAQQAEGGAA